MSIVVAEARTTTLEHVRAIVGQKYARAGRAGDTIDGMVPSLVVTPGTVDQAASVLRFASESGLAVAPTGGGTKLAWGNPPSRFDVLLRTTRLNRVLEHAAGDLVVRAQAGTKLADLQIALGKAGQRLALDSSENGATLGGMVAANASGPLRLRFGTARDQLIGITYVLPDGTVARAGGKVVKSVAGYDLCKLFTGSLGTLGLLVQTIFRLHPVPAARQAVCCRLDSPRRLAEATQAMLHSFLVPSTLDFRWNRDCCLTALFEGISSGVEAQAGAAVTMWQSHGAVSALSGEEYDTWWSEERADWPVSMVISTVPTEIGFVLEHVQSLASDGVDAIVRGQAGNGVSLVDLTGEIARMVPAITHLRQAVGQVSGTLVVRRAPLEIKRQIDVWGQVGDALPLMQRVKARFDPQGTLNPGRFVGGI